MAIPAGLVAKRFGYKGGILVGLSLIAAGAFWFIPAVNIGVYWVFLLGLFVIAAGMTCLETIANPCATVLGPPEGGPTRINIAQTTGSSLIVMAIVGGAIAPPFMGHIADVHSMRTGFVVPLVCFALVALYGFTWPRLNRQDSLSSLDSSQFSVFIVWEDCRCSSAVV